jgi:hypothetical protein
VTRTAIVLSKVFIFLLALAGLLLQAVLLPLQASQSAQQFPEVAFLHIPILVLSILVVVCGHVVLGCVWFLLSLVRRDAIFSERAFRFVDIMIGALVVAGAAILAVLLTIGLSAHAGPPGVVFPGAGIALCCAALALVLVVMRGLLVKATEQERYLAEVV